MKLFVRNIINFGPQGIKKGNYVRIQFFHAPVNVNRLNTMHLYQVHN